jgi:hypothetical protein
MQNKAGSKGRTHRKQKPTNAGHGAAQQDVTVTNHKASQSTCSHQQQNKPKLPTVL